MSLYVCSNINDKNIAKAVSLHIQHLSAGGFITKLGESFLLSLYRDWLTQNNAILIFSADEEHLNGFVLGIKNKQLLFSPIKMKPLKYLKHVLWGLIKNPFLLPKMVESLFYNSKFKASINAELLVIVTDGSHRSQGIGSALVKLLGSEFMKYNIKEYVVTVRAEMTRANNFYVKNNMSLSDSCTFYGKAWNIYHKKIA